MIDRLGGFTENQVTLIKSISSQSFKTGMQWHPDNSRQLKRIEKLQNEIIKLRYKLNESEKIIDSHYD